MERPQESVRVDQVKQGDKVGVHTQTSQADYTHVYTLWLTHDGDTLCGLLD